MITEDQQTALIKGAQDAIVVVHEAVIEALVVLQQLIYDRTGMEMDNTDMWLIGENILANLLGSAINIGLQCDHDCRIDIYEAIAEVKAHWG